MLGRLYHQLHNIFRQHRIPDIFFRCIFEEKYRHNCVILCKGQQALSATFVNRCSGKLMKKSIYYIIIAIRN